VIGDRAVSAVMDTVAHAGYAAEIVSKDYGEDLLVQTSHVGQMDASRLWLQVKGTASLDRHLLKSGDLRLPVSFDHALRWARSADLVAVVLWDVESSRGWYTLPLSQVDQIGGFINERQTMTLQFDRRDAFSSEVVHSLAWESRINHFRYLMLSARSIDRDRAERGEEKSRLIKLLALDFLILLGIVEQTSQNPVLYDVPQAVRDLMIENFIDACLHQEDPVAAVAEAGTRTLFAYVPVRGEQRGLPMILIEEPVEVLVSLLGIPKVIGDNYGI
jgi:hypothetical protein